MADVVGPAVVGPEGQPVSTGLARVVSAIPGWDVLLDGTDLATAVLVRPVDGGHVFVSDGWHPGGMVRLCLDGQPRWRTWFSSPADPFGLSSCHDFIVDAVAALSHMPTVKVDP